MSIQSIEAELAELRAIVRAVATGDWSDDESWRCFFCKEPWGNDFSEAHAPDCPYVRAVAHTKEHPE